MQLLNPGSPRHSTLPRAGQAPSSLGKREAEKPRRPPLKNFVDVLAPSLSLCQNYLLVLFEVLIQAIRPRQTHLKPLRQPL